MIDQKSFQRYQSCQDPTLAPLLHESLLENTDPNTRNKDFAASLKLDSQGRCNFVQHDGLCQIHTILGAEALSDTCAIYPRNTRMFCGQSEYSLALSCPEAARLILLHPQPIHFLTGQANSELEKRNAIAHQFPPADYNDHPQISVFNDFRAVVIGILQYREISLGARMMLLGFLLEDADKVAQSEDKANISALLAVLNNYVNFLSQPQAIEEQFAQLQGTCLQLVDYPVLISRHIIRT